MESNNTKFAEEEEQELLLSLSDVRMLLDIVQLINAILRNGVNLSRSAEDLGIGRRTLYDLMDRYNVSYTDGKLSIELTAILNHAELRSHLLERYLT